MNNNITNIDLSFRCDANWDNMQVVDGARFCNTCNKKVYNFTDAKQQEFLQILAENGNNICGRFKCEQMIPGPIHIPLWKKWISAALILVGINLLHTKAQAQTGKPKAPAKAIIAPDMVVGMYSPMPMPTFPGGDKALMNFLARNIHYKKGAVDGKVFAQFVIKKDGSVGEIKIMRGISPVNDQEVIRVLRSLPRWKPARINGKAIESQYNVPVSFERK